MPVYRKHHARDYPQTESFPRNNIDFFNGISFPYKIKPKFFDYAFGKRSVLAFEAVKSHELPTAFS